LSINLVFEGSLTLIGGDPGVGKSTLLLQVRIILATGMIKLDFRILDGELFFFCIFCGLGHRGLTFVLILTFGWEDSFHYCRRAP